MSIKRIAAGLGATVAVTATLVVATASGAVAEDCYEVGFDHLPNAWVQVNPPQATIDDGDPYVRISPSCFSS